MGETDQDGWDYATSISRFGPGQVCWSPIIKCWAKIGVKEIREESQSREADVVLNFYNLQHNLPVNP
jgi:hypothetical protein